MSIQSFFLLFVLFFFSCLASSSNKIADDRVECIRLESIPQVFEDSCSNYIVERLLTLSGPKTVMVRVCFVAENNNSLAIVAIPYTPQLEPFFCRNEKSTQNTEQRSPDETGFMPVLVSNMLPQTTDDSDSGYGSDSDSDGYDPYQPGKPGKGSSIPLFLTGAVGSGINFPNNLLRLFGIDQSHMSWVKPDTPFLFQRYIVSDNSEILLVLTEGQYRLFHRASLLGSFRSVGSGYVTSPESEGDDTESMSLIHSALILAANGDSVPVRSTRGGNGENQSSGASSKNTASHSAQLPAGAPSLPASSHSEASDNSGEGSKDPNRSSFQCPQCGSIFDSPTQLRSHQSSAHSTEKTTLKLADMVSRKAVSRASRHVSETEDVTMRKLKSDQDSLRLLESIKKSIPNQKINWSELEPLLERLVKEEHAIAFREAFLQLTKEGSQTPAVIEGLNHSLQTLAGLPLNHAVKALANALARLSMTADSEDNRPLVSAGHKMHRVLVDQGLEIEMHSQTNTLSRVEVINAVAAFAEEFIRKNPEFTVYNLTNFEILQKVFDTLLELGLVENHSVDENNTELKRWLLALFDQQPERLKQPSMTFSKLHSLVGQTDSVISGPLLFAALMVMSDELNIKAEIIKALQDYTAEVYAISESYSNNDRITVRGNIATLWIYVLKVDLPAHQATAASALKTATPYLTADWVRLLQALGGNKDSMVQPYVLDRKLSSLSLTSQKKHNDITKELGITVTAGLYSRNEYRHQGGYNAQYNAYHVASLFLSHGESKIAVDIANGVLTRVLSDRVKQNSSDLVTVFRDNLEKVFRALDQGNWFTTFQKDQFEVIHNKSEKAYFLLEAFQTATHCLSPQRYSNFITMLAPLIPEELLRKIKLD